MSVATLVRRSSVLPRRKPITVRGKAQAKPATPPAPTTLPIAPATPPAPAKPVVSAPAGTVKTGTVNTSSETRETYRYTLSGLISLKKTQLGDICRKEGWKGISKYGIAQRIQFILADGDHSKVARTGKLARAVYSSEALKAQCAAQGFKGFKSASRAQLASMLDNGGVKPAKVARQSKPNTKAFLIAMMREHNVKGRTALGKLPYDALLDCLLGSDNAALIEALNAAI